jgi:mercuric ion transport protein
LSRTPTLELLCSALLAVHEPATSRGRFRALVASFPAIGTPLLPKLTCPLCWPAYTAVLSALGLGFVDYTPYLLPATLAFLAIAVGSLAIGARRTGRLRPLVLGLTSSGVVLAGKFAVDSAWVTDAGIALLMGAVFLAARIRAVQPASCPACAPAGSEPKTQAR